MAKNFGAAGNGSFAAVGEKEKVKAQVVTIVNIPNDCLIDNPENGEDISRTEDLELSMEQNGFTDPLEVTDFGMPEGKYMIVSGHRRRAAGVKRGMDVFPCIVRHFADKSAVDNYALLSNSYRDSAKEPLLYARRYKLHKKYLEESSFDGNIREEVARRLGLSIAQADRYAAMDRIILPVWDMVQAEIVGMSAVQPMASHPVEEQADIYGIMQEALACGVQLSRDLVKKLVDLYRAGMRTWDEIAEALEDGEAQDSPGGKHAAGESSIPLNAFINDEPGESRGPREYSRNDEVRREYDPIAAEYDLMDEDRRRWEEDQEDGEEDGTPEPTEREKAELRGDEVFKALAKLKKCFSEDYACRDTSDAEKMIGAMAEVLEELVVQMNNTAAMNGLESLYYEKKKDLENTIRGCM